MTKNNRHSLGKIDTFNVLINKNVERWAVGKLAVLFRLNSRKFEKIFGRNKDWYYCGNDVWIEKFKGSEFVIFTSKRSGTSYEIVFKGTREEFINSKEIENIIKEFLISIFIKDISLFISEKTNLNGAKNGLSVLWK